MITHFQRLSSIGSTNEKITYLESIRHDVILKRIFKMALCPSTQYYIKCAPIVSEHSGEMTLSDGLDSLSVLTKREKTGHAAIDHLSTILSKLSDGDAEIVSMVVQKDLRCGIGGTLINRVFKNLIPKYPCLLASEYSAKNMNNIVFPALSQVKSDGMRINFVCRNDGVYVYGRSGKQTNVGTTFGNIIASLATSYGGECVIDGELLVVDDGGSFLERKKGNGLLNSLYHISKAIDDGSADATDMATFTSITSKVRVRAWDIIPYADFVNGKCVTPYLDRFNNLRTLIGDMCIATGDLIEVIPTVNVSSIEDIFAHYADCTLIGEEGVIVKNLAGIWESKRSKDLVKLKAELDCDLVVTGWKDGTGKHKGNIGSLICESADGLISVSIGSGLSDDERSLDPHSLIGRIVAIRYNGRITSVNDTVSLYLPRLLEFRQDKDTADHSSTIR